VLRRHGLRTAVNRFAEAAALAAVAAAALYPILHLGRPWLFYWVLPYPATYQVWPQFRSTLVWDLWGIMSHVIVTSLFWYTGLIPDLATMRDRAPRAGGCWRRGSTGWRRSAGAARCCTGRGTGGLPAGRGAGAADARLGADDRGAGIRDDAGAGLAPGAAAAACRRHRHPSASASCSQLAVVLRMRLDLGRFIDDADMELLGEADGRRLPRLLWLYGRRAAPRPGWREEATAPPPSPRGSSADMPCGGGAG
jgi:molybdopterin-containing oxidoreductase family membrane subunit